MEIIIKLKRIELKGTAVTWKETDPGFKKYAGSVWFDNDNYLGFLRHDGKVELLRNNRKFGTHEPTNFTYA